MGHGSPRIVSTWRHLQHSVDELNTRLASLKDVVFVRVDRDDYFMCWRPGPVTKTVA